MAELLDGVLWALGMLRSRANSRDAGEPVPVEGDYTAALRAWIGFRPACGPCRMP
ncbi:hypothetical protein ABT063_24490 [Streptomyces sp. NPDC002838]|uniref:hypothetical protein n=1 Tax=Streptomyces sp. NPDC002838 TaxID=3154436 RepID=UPI0033254ED6